MTRRIFLMFLVLGTACTQSQMNLYGVLPQNLEGGWVREQIRAMAAQDAPEVVSRPALKQWVQASYRNNGRVTVQAFEMKTEPSAFELVQKWRPSDGAAFYKGPLFIVCVDDGAGAEAASALARALEKSITVGR